MADEKDVTLLSAAGEYDSTRSLAASIRALPQRDDTGVADDGPKVEECRPAQRLRIPAPDPNCVERSAWYALASEWIDPAPIRRLATIRVPGGLHTIVTEDGIPVVLDPRHTRNALRAGLFHASQRNGGAIAVTPTGAVDWIAELADEPAARFVGGHDRARNGHRALRGVLDGVTVCSRDAPDIAFVLALAEREARLYGPTGPRIVRTIAYAVDRLDRLAVDRWKQSSAPRNATLSIGGYSITPNLSLLGSLARAGGRLGGKVGIEALKAKLAQLGVGSPVLNSVEQALNREGLSLGALSKPPAILGSLGALTPEALAGRWLASKL